jgi:hypothetical protein
MPTKHQPDYSYLRGVPLSMVHLLEVKILLMGLAVFMPKKHQPDYSYLRRVPISRVHLLK